MKAGLLGRHPKIGAEPRSRMGLVVGTRGLSMQNANMTNKALVGFEKAPVALASCSGWGPFSQGKVKHGCFKQVYSYIPSLNNVG